MSALSGGAHSGEVHSFASYVSECLVCGQLAFFFCAVSPPGFYYCVTIDRNLSTACI